MYVYIPNDITIPIPEKELFILTRPFKIGESWGNSEEVLRKWNLQETDIRFTGNVAEASFIFLPYTINLYQATGNFHLLKKYNQLCDQSGIQAYGFISGDWCASYPEFERITYLRSGGFRSQLSLRNQGFPVVITDMFKEYIKSNSGYRVKEKLPTVGFCGHAALSPVKRAKEATKFVLENFKKLVKNPFRNDWEPVFSSAYQRASLLKLLERDSAINTNFIYRNKYRAGANTQLSRAQTSTEYFQNIIDSDYVLCLRGGGNFSVRFYHTLMMGRIPVLVNTDCLLPFQDTINWKEHVVWVEWNQRKEIDRIVDSFHHKLSPDEFRNMQQRNRKLWLETLSVKGIFNLLSTGLLTKKLNTNDAEIS